MTELMDDQDSLDEHLAAGRMTIWEHIAELRTRLIRCCIAVALGMAIGFFLYPYLIEFLKLPYQELTGKTEFLAFDPLEPFATRLKISAYVGIVFAMPVLLWQIWRFVTPGLYPHEKRYAVPFVVSAMFLFVFGAAIAYLTLNPALQFLQQMGAGQVDSFYTIDNYVTLIAYMMLAFGIGFEFPVLLVALQIAGVLTPRQLIGWWRQAVVTIAVVAAVITPSGDPISMMALAVPMYLFYLIACLIGFVLARRKRKRTERAEAVPARSQVAPPSVGPAPPVPPPHDFELDAFQRQAVAALDDGQSVLVAAPTGSGKTVVAEHAVARALASGDKVFYTTPIKALSNQKFHDLAARHGAANVGLLTGDNAVRPDAPIVVMTTEVLRNMIYARSTALDRLRFVVLDEVHYLQDAYRGPVWEEVIIHLPQAVKLVCLSATVSNAPELAHWIELVRGPTATVVETARPVELVNLFAVDDRSAEQLQIIPTLVDGQPNPHGQRFDQVAAGDPRGRPRRRFSPPRRVELIELLAERDLLPAIYFIFSRAGCDDAMRACLRAGLRLTEAADRPRIRAIVERHVSSLSDDDLELLGYREWADGLEHGIAAHHAGMVPPFKEAVEECFAAGLVPVVFATETLALGINMPARTVIIEKLTKFTGERHEFLTPGQYTQLTGRAGRRGIDAIGHAVVAWSPFVPFADVAALAASRTFVLTSSFRPTYNMAANLVRRYDAEQAHHLLNLSFAQYQADRAVVRLELRLGRREAALAEARDEATCERGDVDEYVRLLDAARHERDDRRRDGAGEVARALADLRPGAVVRLRGGKNAGPVAVVAVSQRKGAVKVRAITESRRVLNLTVDDFDQAPDVTATITLPDPYAPHSPAFQRQVAQALHRLPRVSAGRARRPAAPGGSPRDAWTHPVADCPDADRHVRAARRLGRGEREVAELKRQIEHHTQSLARDFDRILQLLEAWEYLDGWALSPRGERLVRIYHESDLLIAECLELGLLDDLEPASLAGLVSCFTYEHRSPNPPPPPWFPSADVRDRVDRVAQVAADLNADETLCRLPLTRLPDPTFFALAHGWAAGESLHHVLEDEDLSGGDFVRNAKQLIDLLRQIGDAAASGDTRRRARQAADAVFRGVVAASSALGPDDDLGAEGTDVPAPATDEPATAPTRDHADP